MEEVKISQFLDEDGRLTQLPRKRAPRMAALEYLASKFETGRTYTEHEVNALCSSWHTFDDFYILRRELVEARLLCRERDGSKYWRPEAVPAAK